MFRDRDRDRDPQALKRRVYASQTLARYHTTQYDVTVTVLFMQASRKAGTSGASKRILEVTVSVTVTVTVTGYLFNPLTAATSGRHSHGHPDHMVRVRVMVLGHFFEQRNFE
jgi:hypothetical protein